MDAAFQVEGKRTRAVLAASGRFGRFRPETERNVRNQGVQPNPVTDAMKDAWKKCVYFRDWHVVDWDNQYPDVLSKVRNLRYSAEDIRAFSLDLASCQNEISFSVKAGLFLSALINNSLEERFVIHTLHLAEPVDSLGYCNTKTIIVEGNVGREAGYMMKGGTMTIKGDAGFFLGEFMSGGVITVEGNAGFGAGNMMNYGKLIINGEAGQGIGEEMQGGEIHLNGDYWGISSQFFRGSIYHKGELLLQK